jgi:hypothetical protein
MGKTFVYVCKNGKNEELRYSLRSIEKFYPDATVWVVGGKPDWYIGNYIKSEQNSNRFSNVKNSLALACKNIKIPNDIVVMNDDFIFVREIDDIKHYYGGTLRDKVLQYRKHKASPAYVTQLVDLYRFLKHRGKTMLDFELHVPMPVQKDLLIQVLGDEVMWRSNYGNRFVSEDTLEQIEDVKVYEEGNLQFKSYDYASKRYPFLSTQDTSFDTVYNNLLKDLFPEPSKYEYYE